MLVVKKMVDLFVIISHFYFSLIFRLISVILKTRAALEPPPVNQTNLY